MSESYSQGEQQSPSSSLKKRVSRCLFGRVNAEESNKWLQERLDNISSEQANRWNFDFRAECPLPGSCSRLDGSSGSEDSLCEEESEWHWEPVSVGCVPSPYRPVVYSTPRPAPRAPVKRNRPSQSRTQSLHKATSSAQPISGFFASRKRAQTGELMGKESVAGHKHTPSGAASSTVGPAPKVSRTVLACEFAHLH